jgi:hypothetical protein
MFYTPAGSPILRNNWHSSWIIPTGNSEEYYSFVATGNDTISFQSAHEGLRFRIVNPVNNVTMFNSANESRAHSVDPNGWGRNHFTRWRINNLTPGLTYNLILYRANGHNSSPGFINSSFAAATPHVVIAVGGPRLISHNTHSVTQSPNLTVNSSTTWADRLNINVNGLPASAFVTRIELTHAGAGLSNLQDFRYRPGTLAWTTSIGRNPVFNVPYTYLGTSNRAANGTWSVGYRASFPTLSVLPGFRLTYYYELGNFSQAG